MEGVHHSLALPMEQEKVKGFLTNSENVRRVNCMVEEIYEVMVEYQVCTLNYSFPTMSDICARLRCNKIFMMRIANSL